MRTRNWLVMAIFLGGCATAGPSGETMEATAASIRAAEELGAPRVPAASLHLQLAKEQSQHAKQLLAMGDGEEAGFLMMRADADAELALALSRSSVENAKAQKAIEKVRTMQTDAP
jgi:hypothetical protein